MGAMASQQWPVNSPHKSPVTWKKFPFDDVIMLCLVVAWCWPLLSTIASGAIPSHFDKITWEELFILLTIRAGGGGGSGGKRWGGGGGGGVIEPFSYVPSFWFSLFSIYRIPIRYNFHICRCHRSWSALTRIKYGSAGNYSRGTITKSNISLTEKFTGVWVVLPPLHTSTFSPVTD